MKEQYRKLRAFLKLVKDNDRTNPYSYSPGPESLNRHGVAPKPGQRWLTPYELACQKLKELKNSKEDSYGKK